MTLPRSNCWRLVTAAVVLVATGLGAQSPHELGRQDKIELYLQYLGRVVQVQPEVFSALLLEFELARSLHEMGTAHPESLIGEFIERSNKKLHPRYARAVELRQEGNLQEARQIFEALAREKELYVVAGAELHQAEIDHASGRHEACLRRATEFVERRRQFVLGDYRACELMALGFRAAKNSLLEFLQLHILLIDYREVPPEVEARAKKRLAELQGEVGKPLGVVSDWMGAVERWIKAYETSADPTQTKQDEIRAGLEKLIELQVAKERNSCSNCGKGG